jgi:hypothetical protein
MRSGRSPRSGSSIDSPGSDRSGRSRLIRDLGLPDLDAGPLDNAVALEALAGVVFTEGAGCVEHHRRVLRIWTPEIAWGARERIFGLMRWWSRVVVVMMALGGACSARTLERSALRYDAKANRAAELGDGRAAARERQKAENLRASARMRSEKHVSWLWYDLTLD